MVVVTLPVCSFRLRCVLMVVHDAFHRPAFAQLQHRVASSVRLCTSMHVYARPTPTRRMLYYSAFS